MTVLRSVRVRPPWPSVIRTFSRVDSGAEGEADTAKVPLFFVVSQAPDSGTAARPGDTVALRFNHPGRLCYWNASVIPLMGDLENTL
jgi:hypothetical protein